MVTVGGERTARRSLSLLVALTMNASEIEVRDGFRHLTYLLETVQTRKIEAVTLGVRGGICGNSTCQDDTYGLLLSPEHVQYAVVKP